MVREMTKGRPMSLIMGFFVPMLLGNIFQQLYNMVDTIIVGQYCGVDALAAVGSTGSLNFLVIGFVMGIANGFAIPVAQSFGARQIKDMRSFIANGVYLAALVTVVLTAVTMLFTRPILEIMQTPADIIDMAYDYIIVIFAGIAVIMLYNYLAFLMRSLGDSRSPLIFLAIASFANIGFDLLFICVFNWGVSGAAWATVLAQLISGVLCFVYVKRKYDILAFEKDEFRVDIHRIKKLCKIGFPMALQFSITAIGSIILQSAVNSLGTGIVAAVTAANKIQNLVAQPMETMGITMATYCGQNLGAGLIPRIKKGIHQSLIFTICYALIAMGAVCLFGEGLAMLFIDSAETVVIENTAYFLKINSIFYVVLSVLFLLRNSLQGLGYSFLPMMAGVSELAARALVSFGFVGIFGFNAVCVASPTAWVFATILLVITYVIKMKKLMRDYRETNAESNGVSSVKTLKAS
ncbi:MAG: MATE family efflux transporter [Ruminiclostridium sp.]